MAGKPVGRQRTRRGRLRGSRRWRQRHPWCTRMYVCAQALMQSDAPHGARSVHSTRPPRDATPRARRLRLRWAAISACCAQRAWRRSLTRQRGRLARQGARRCGLGAARCSQDQCSSACAAALHGAQLGLAVPQVVVPVPAPRCTPHAAALLRPAATRLGHMRMQPGQTPAPPCAIRPCAHRWCCTLRSGARRLATAGPPLRAPGSAWTMCRCRGISLRHPHSSSRSTTTTTTSSTRGRRRGERMSSIKRAWRGRPRTCCCRCAAWCGTTARRRPTCGRATLLGAGSTSRRWGEAHYARPSWTCEAACMPQIGSLDWR